MKAIFRKRMIMNRKGVIKKLLKIAGYPEKNETLCYLAEAYGKRILILGSLSLDADTDYPRNAELAVFPYQGSDKLLDIGKEVFRRLAPTAVLLCFDAESPKLSLLLWAGHFVLIFGITLLLLRTFGWCAITPMSVLLTFFAVVFIYLFTCFVHYLVDRKHTSIMNQQLKKRYATDNKGLTTEK